MLEKSVIPVPPGDAGVGNCPVGWGQGHEHVCEAPPSPGVPAAEHAEADERDDGSQASARERARASLCPSSPHFQPAHWQAQDTSAGRAEGSAYTANQ